MKWIAWTGFALLFLYEIWAMAYKPGQTISDAIWWATERTPLVPFALGMMAGHLFWQK